uniref:RAB, member RAS oncogene family-like 6b n=1 Tax=Ciona savignyi TaxID=51511 RepID=H2YS55_CIOSA
MFTSIKKWVKNEDNPPSRGATSVSGMQTMRSDLQRKFAKGVQYNLKIIIRGDRNTGKTCLWHRLQGHKFLEEYVPTPEIQAASIHWNYKATDDVVKVDVWDVVDQGKPKKPKETLKLDHKDDEDDELQLDASFLDVYKGAHAVIMVFDITKKWTFNYIERELPKVPPHIPVLILGNHRDMGDHRVISFDEIEALTESIERPPGSAGVSFLETSMKEGFGLKYIHKFINMPFLLLQRESLLKQLETNHLDMESCLEELQYTAASDEHSYEAFKERPKNPPKSTSTPVQSKPDIVNAKPPTPNTTPSTNDCKKPPTTLNIPQTQQAQDSEPISPSGGLFSPSEMSEVPSQPTETTQPEKRGFMSRLFRGDTTTKSDAVKSDPPPVTPPVSNPPPVKSIEEFVPPDEAVDDFLNSISNPADKIRHQDSDESSSDDDGGNPMVAGFQEELDSDDQMPDAAGSHKVYTYSDSDEDYTASTQAKRVTQPKKQSSRGKPASRLSPAQDRRNDSNLQGFMIESDTSDENDAQPPSILPDAESLSENDLAEAESPKSKPSNHIEQNTATQLYKSDSNQYLRNERN